MKNYYWFMLGHVWAPKRKMCCPNRTLAEDHILSAIYAEIHGKSCSCEYMAQIVFPRDDEVNVNIKEKRILSEFPLLRTAKCHQHPSQFLWCADMNATWSARQMRLKITEDKNIPTSNLQFESSETTVCVRKLNLSTSIKDFRQITAMRLQWLDKF